MKGKALRQQYDRLTPAERVRLYLAAIVRRDEDEIRALQRTCPPGHAREVGARVEAFPAATQRLAWPWTCAMRTIAKGEVLALVMERLAGDRSALAAILDARGPDGEPLSGSFAGEWMARHCWRAWQRFAEGTGADPRDVLAVFAPSIAADLDGLAHRFADLDAEDLADRFAASPAGEEAIDRLAAVFAADYRQAVAAALGSPRGH